MLHFRYGHIVSKIQNILILWVPRTHLESIAQTVIPIIRHKETIKRTLRATFLLRIEIHSYLKQSFILSELYSRGLMDEMLLRVFLRTNSFSKLGSNESESDNENEKKKQDSSDLTDLKGKNNKNRRSQYFAPEMYKVVVVRDWTFKRFKQEIASQFHMDYNKIQMTHVPFYRDKEIEHSKKFHNPRNRGITLTNDEKSLWQLGLLHGSKVYISYVFHAIGIMFANLQQL